MAPYSPSKDGMGCLRLSLPDLPEAVSFNICCQDLFHLLSLGLFSDLVLQVAD